MKARQQIIDGFDALSPRRQVAARFVIDHPNEVVIGSMRTLAERARSLARRSRRPDLLDDLFLA